ncbi:MAG: hypothetical protein D3908_02550 [Candidatus Electrothrix sp. AUS4]|nr:hypothetical protein [Candidatus Electrothrix sp. AUS4]
MQSNLHGLFTADAPTLLQKIPERSRNLPAQKIPHPVLTGEKGELIFSDREEEKIIKTKWIEKT